MTVKFRLPYDKHGEFEQDLALRSRPENELETNFWRYDNDTSDR